MTSDAFTYDPYEWFDPETGRPLRRVIISEVANCLLHGQLPDVKRASDYLESLSGFRSVSTVPLDKLEIVGKAMRMLSEQRNFNKLVRTRP